MGTGNGTKVTKKPDPFEEQFNALEALSGETTGENDLIYTGNKFIIPEKYDLTEAIKQLVRKQKDDETPVQLSRTFEYRPMDGAYAFYNAILKHFGTVNSKRFKEATMFSKQEGTMWVDVPVAVGETKSLPWGQVFTPVIPDHAFTLSQVNSKDKGPLFSVFIECPRKYKKRVEGLFKLVEKELHENSLYRGKAFTGEMMPQFLDLSGVDPAKVVYPEELWAHLNFSVLSNLNKRDRLERLGMPKKRSILFEGYYGSGKTLAGYIIGQESVANDITFIYCRPQDDINLVLQTARLYQPSCVLAEDIDVAADADPAQPDKNKIMVMLDTFDGIRAKGTDIMCVLTTNHADKLHKGLMRHGRLDDVISFGKFDAPAVRKLIEVVLGGALSPTIDWDPVVEAYLDLYPSAIVEAAQRSIRYAAVTRDEDDPIVSEVDLVYARQSLNAQLQKMDDAPEMSERDRLGNVVGNIVADAANTILEEQLNLRFGEPARD